MGKSAPTRAAATAPAHVTPFNFGEHAVRVAQDDHGQPWFVAADIADALGYNDAKDALRCVDTSEKGAHIVPTLGGKQRMTTVNEAGLYALILRSRKPAAKAFSRWVRGDVLPNLRKTGQYIAHSKPNQPLPGIKPAQSAIKQIAPPAFNPANLIGKGLPPLPAGLEFPPELAAQIEAAAIAQAMQCIPALRAYLQRRLAYTARNAQGWMPEQFAPSLAAASLQDALNYEAHRDLRSAINLAQALQTIAAQALASMQARMGGGV